MIESLQRAIAIIEYLGRQSAWSGLREIARSTGIPSSATHRFLQTFVAAGWIEKSGLHPRVTRYQLTGRIMFNTLLGTADEKSAGGLAEKLSLDEEPSELVRHRGLTSRTVEQS